VGDGPEFTLVDWLRLELAALTSERDCLLAERLRLQGELDRLADLRLHGTQL
jgi:hypothetical protein